MKNPHLFNVSFYIRKNKSKIKDYGIYCCINAKLNPTLFVFCCYTGMASCDLQCLKPNQIYFENGINWMTYKRIKSEVEANVPLLNPAVGIIKKYTKDEGYRFRHTVFQKVSNRGLNQSLKVISECCELGCSLNFYTARHTFATTVALATGISSIDRQTIGYLQVINRRLPILTLAVIVTTGKVLPFIFA